MGWDIIIWRDKESLKSKIERFFLHLISLYSNVLLPAMAYTCTKNANSSTINNSWRHWYLRFRHNKITRSSIDPILNLELHYGWCFSKCVSFFKFKDRLLERTKSPFPSSRHRSFGRRFHYSIVPSGGWWHRVQSPNRWRAETDRGGTGNSWSQAIRRELA